MPGAGVGPGVNRARIQEVPKDSPVERARQNAEGLSWRRLRL